MKYGELNEEFIDSLPDFIGDKIDLFGQSIVALGNVLTVLGIAAEATEVEEVDEDIEGGASAGDSVQESNIGFVLALIGASLITIGDLVSSGGIALEIQIAAVNEKKAKRHQEEQEKRFKNLENRVLYMQRDMNTLIQKTESLQNEVIFLRKTLYPNHY